MPPRDDQELPEGTDQIINGAMETGAGAGASTGSGFGGVGQGGTTPGGSADFAGSGATGSGAFMGAGGGDDTGGFAGGGSSSPLSGTASSGLGGGSDFGGSGSSGLGSSGSGLGGSGSLASTGGGGSGFGGSGGDLGGSGGGSFGDGFESGQSGGSGDGFKGGVQGLKSQATEKVRAYASDGKQRATTALDDLSQLVNETAQSIDEKLGPQYGDYARSAASAVSGFADTVRNKDVDELFDDAREIVRKSPGVAIGAAAVIGFGLVRLLKAGMTDEKKDVSFKADPALSGPGAGSGADSQAPYVAPSTTGV